MKLLSFRRRRQSPSARKILTWRIIGTAIPDTFSPAKCDCGRAIRAARAEECLRAACFVGINTWGTSL